MGHFVMVSLISLVYIIINQHKISLSLFQNEQLLRATKRLRRPLSDNIFTDKNKMAATKKQCFFTFSVLTGVFTYRHSKSGVYK